MHTRPLVFLFVLALSGTVRAADPPVPANHFDLQQRKVHAMGVAARAAADAAGGS